MYQRMSTARCGDGIVQAGVEACDGTSDCTDDCTLIALCGNGRVELGEECDDGNTRTENCVYGERACLVCNAVCHEEDGQTSFCGDGIVDAVHGEACDNNECCNDDCTLPGRLNALACADSPTGCPAIQFVQIAGGVYDMGSNTSPATQPIHRVNVPDFEIMSSEVTVGQYRQCVEAGACDVPNCNDADFHHGQIACNWSQNREMHPVNYVNWHNAMQFASWVGVRLPSEASGVRLVIEGEMILTHGAMSLRHATALT